MQSDVKPELSKLHLQVTKTVMSSSACSIKASIPTHFRFQLFTVPVCFPMRNCVHVLDCLLLTDNYVTVSEAMSAGTKYFFKSIKYWVM